MRRMFSHLTVLLTTVFLFIASPVFAAGESDFPPSYFDVVAMIVIAIILLGFIVFIYAGDNKGVVEKESKEVKKESSALAKFGKYMTQTTPVENEDEILMEHSFDGIQELDSKVPPWFSWLFYLTIAFAVFYLLNYHIFKASPLQDEEYQLEVKQAEIERTAQMKSGDALNEENVTLLTDQLSVDAGKQIFAANCVACHAADGGGLVGPNLTDDYWIHGGGIKNVFKTIKYGVPAKGMIAWSGQLTPKQIQEVASYVISLHGTKPANPKAPEGAIWKDEE